MRSFSAHLLFASLFAVVLFALHAPVLDTPYFWDEMGQFVPAALDLYHDGALIPHSTVPNVHPPGVMAYLAAFWKLFGYSVLRTRTAMLLLAAAGVYVTFLLTIELGKPLDGAPALTAAVLLCASPLFWAQSMMAQLDMPAMVFSVLALLLFLKGNIAGAAAASVLAVLAKETAIAVPAVLGAMLWYERRWRDGLWFALPAVILVSWLTFLYSQTGHLLGNAEFTHYNVTFQLHPVRLGMTVLRRAFYLLGDNFHFIGTVVLVLAYRRTRMFHTRAWLIVTLLFVFQTLLVSVLGGAALERYLVPVLPLYYAAAAAAFTALRPKWRLVATAAMAIGLFGSLFINSPLTYPFENNLAFVDFVTLQKSASEFVEANYADQRIMSAWPFPDALRRPEFGYVSRPIRAVGLDNFNPETVIAAKGKGDVLVLYSRTSEPRWSLVRVPAIQRFLTEYYYYRPQITGEEVQRELGLMPVGRWERRGQWIEVFASSRTPNVLVL